MVKFQVKDKEVRDRIMRKKICYVIGDHFAGFSSCAHGIVNYSHLLTCFEQQKVCAERYIVGQGMTYEGIQALQNQLSNYCSLSDVKIHEMLSVRVSPEVVHKHCMQNVHITEPVRVSDLEFVSSLVLHDQCSEMSDHVTGVHVPGIVLIEAARQMFMAVAEMYFLEPKQRGNYSYVLTQVRTEFHGFLFPVEVEVKFTMKETCWERNRTLLRGSGTISLSQFDQVGCNVHCAGTAFPSRMLKSLENRNALRVKNIIANKNRTEQSNQSNLTAAAVNKNRCVGDSSQRCDICEISVAA